MVNQPGRFMTAEWKNLLMLNYSVDGSMLESFVPAGTELDAFEGKYYLSLVGFEFNRSHLFGIKVPFHQTFEEVNLRFYVKRAEKRGVVFIRELVPKFAVAAIARLLYKENYSCTAMSHRISANDDADKVEAVYTWGSGRLRCSMSARAEGTSTPPRDGSLSQFITEHYWGYSKHSGGGSLEYEVKHPVWNVASAESAAFSGDAASIYGIELSDLLTRKPDSAFLAEGSAVTVFHGTRIV